MFFTDWFLPKDPEQLYHRAWDLMEAKHYDKALTLLNRLEQLCPQWADAYYTQGLCLEKKGDVADAKEAYQYALSLNPDNIECVYNLARLFYETGDWETAQSYGEHAKSLAGEMGGDAQISYLLGAIYEEKSNLDLAILSYEEARQLDPANFLGRAFLANIYVTLQEHDKALGVYQELVDSEPANVDAWYEMSLCYAKQGNWEKTIECCDRVLAIDGQYMQAYNQKGLACYCMDNITGAIENYSKALSIQPNYATAINNLAYAYERQGNITDAVTFFTRYLAFTNERPVERAEVENHIKMLQSQSQPAA